MSRRTFAQALTNYSVDDTVLALTSMTFPVGGSTGPHVHLTAAAPPVAPATPSGTPRWAGVIGVEGELTGDGRLIEKNALRWENLPIPFRYVSSDMGMHDGAVVVGQIDKISRGRNGEILGEGTWDPNSVYGQEAMRLVDEGLQTGVSMDLDDVSFEIRVAAELLDEAPLGGLLLAIGDDEEAPALPEPDADGRVKVAEIGSDDEIRVTTSGRIRAATLVSIPAFAGAQIHMADATDMPAEPSTKDECSCTEGDPAYDPNCVCPEAPAAAAASGLRLVAAAAPVEPPAAWFNRPALTGPTAVVITKDGQMYGHLATWDSCHIAHLHNGCTPPPHSATGYAYFHTGAVLTAEGAQIPTGRITMNTRHAGDNLSMAATLAHYEDTGAAVADVVCGEDEWGIWVAGALRPNLTPNQIRELRAAPLSGDWRRVAGNLELCAALAVNVAGFPIPRPAGLVAGGVMQSLVAAGMLPPRLVVQPGTPRALSDDDLMYLKRLADRERAADSIKAAASVVPDAAELARRVHMANLTVRAHRKAGQ